MSGFALDEYVGIPPSTRSRTRRYIRREVIEPLGLDPARVLVPDGRAADLDAACQAYEAAIRRRAASTCRSSASAPTATSASTSRRRPSARAPGSRRWPRGPARTTPASSTRRTRCPRTASPRGSARSWTRRELLLVAQGEGRRRRSPPRSRARSSACAPASILQFHQRRHGDRRRGRGRRAHPGRLLPLDLRQQADLAALLTLCRTALDPGAAPERRRNDLGCSVGSSPDTPRPRLADLAGTARGRLLLTAAPSDPAEQTPNIAPDQNVTAANFHLASREMLSGSEKNGRLAVVHDPRHGTRGQLLAAHPDDGCGEILVRPNRHRSIWAPPGEHRVPRPPTTPVGGLGRESRLLRWGAAVWVELTRATSACTVWNSVSSTSTPDSAAPVRRRRPRRRDGDTCRVPGGRHEFARAARVALPAAPGPARCRHRSPGRSGLGTRTSDTRSAALRCGNKDRRAPSDRRGPRRRGGRTGPAGRAARSRASGRGLSDTGPAAEGVRSGCDAYRVEHEAGQGGRRPLPVERGDHGSRHLVPDPEAATRVAEQPAPAADHPVQPAAATRAADCSRSGDQGVSVAQVRPEWKIPSRSCGERPAPTRARRAGRHLSGEPGALHARHRQHGDGLGVGPSAPAPACAGASAMAVTATVDPGRSRVPAAGRP